MQQFANLNGQRAVELVSSSLCQLSLVSIQNGLNSSHVKQKPPEALSLHMVK